MLISLHDSDLRRVAFMDNSKPNTLHFYNDVWHRYLVEATSTFDFTVSKCRNNPELAYLTDKNYISFRYDNRDYLFNIMKVEETETEVTCYSENLNLELLNETDSARAADGAKTFVQYLNLCGFTYAQFEVGLNEIADRQRTLSWDGDATKLNRLLSIATGFDAEIEFETILERDGTVKKMVLNVYKQHDDDNQGVGTRRADRTLYYGKSVNGIRRTIDKTGLYTAIYPIGKDGLTINSISKTVSEDGLTYVKKSGDGMIRCPEMMQAYPSQVFDLSADRYIKLDWDYDTDSADTLYSKSLAKLKSICVPATTYEIDGKLDLDLGDTVTVQDSGFTPTLILEARVSEQQISFSDPTQGKNTFDNAKALDNKLSSGILSALERAVQNAASYSASIIKNADGDVLTAVIKKGNADVTDLVTTQWSALGSELSTETTVNVDTEQLYGTVLFQLDAKNIDGAVLCSTQTQVISDKVDAGNIFGQVKSDQIAPGAIGNEQIADSVVDNAKLEDGSVTPIKTNIPALSDLTNDLGVCTAGVIQSPDGALKIDLSDEKNIKVTSATKNTTLYIDADGTRVVSNRTGEIVAQFTEDGTLTNTINAEVGLIADLRIEERGTETWISKG